MKIKGTATNRRQTNIRYSAIIAGRLLKKRNFESWALFGYQLKHIDIEI